MLINILAKLLGVVVFTVLLTSCGNDSEVANLDLRLADGAVQFNPETAVAAATDFGAEDAQLSLLSDGSLSFVEVEQANERAFGCVESFGVEVDRLGISNDRGFPFVNYGIPVEVEAEWDKCDVAESKYVNGLWQQGNTISDPLADAADRRERVRQFAECVNTNGDIIVDIEAVVDGSISVQTIAGEADRLFEEDIVDCYTLSGLIEP